MVSMNFNITDSDFDRLCEIKEQDSEFLNKSINDFAKEILTKQIHFLHYQLSQKEPEETL